MDFNSRSFEYIHDRAGLPSVARVALPDEARQRLPHRSEIGHPLPMNSAVIFRPRNTLTAAARSLASTAALRRLFMLPEDIFGAD